MKKNTLLLVIACISLFANTFAQTRIAGGDSLCLYSVLYLTGTPSGGTWTCSNSNVNLGLGSGIVFGESVGTATITYTDISTGSTATLTVTVQSSIPPYTSVPIVCIGSNPLSLTAPIAGGYWSSYHTDIASFSGSGGNLLSGISQGIDTITYTYGACQDTVVFTVNAPPAPIVGNTNICNGATTTYLDDTLGGTWSILTGTSVTINPISGVLISTGADTISIAYTATTGCSATTPITINPLPSNIILSIASLCAGGSITASEISSGGYWYSSNHSVTTIDSVSGNIIGIGGGTDTISYTYSATGCTQTQSITVNPFGPILPNITNICYISPTTFHDTAAGGSWSVSNTNATVTDIGSGYVVVTGIDTNTTYTLSYTIGSCSTSLLLHIHGYPVIGSISGPDTLYTQCGGNYRDTVCPGGVWSSATPGFSLTSSGHLAALHSGTAIITYSSTGYCPSSVIKSVVVDTTPICSINIDTALCLGSTNTYFISISDSSSVDSTSFAFEVSGVVAITPSHINPVYIHTISSGPVDSFVVILHSRGCSLPAYITSFNVVPLPSAGTITGNTFSCFQGQTTTLSDVGATGSTYHGWHSSNPAIASIDSITGVVHGLVLGSIVTITYTSYNATCKHSTTYLDTVKTLPPHGTISGVSDICLYNSITLSDDSMSSANTWFSTNNSIAIISNIGVVMSQAVGNVWIYDSLVNRCGVVYDSALLTIRPLPVLGVISGSNSVCQGSTVQLSDTATSLISQVWSSFTPSIATVSSSTGVVTGIASGTTTITVTGNNAWCVADSTFQITVNPLPNPGVITGVDSLCNYATISLSETIAGGTWGASSNAVTVTNGSVHSVLTIAMPTIVTVSDTFKNTVTGCMAYSSKTITINPIPATPANITGDDSVFCVNTSMVLSDISSATANGYKWVSKNPLVATIGSKSGITSGIKAGIDTITFIDTNIYHCYNSTTKAITVQVLDSGIISGISSFCVGSLDTLNETILTGVWSIANPALVSIITNGPNQLIVQGVLADTTAVTYTVHNQGCGTKTATVNMIVKGNPPVPDINIYPPSPLCLNTMYQNFGTDSPLHSGNTYYWQVTNDSFYAQGSNGAFCLVSFYSSGTATVVLVDASTNGCISTSSPVTITVSNNNDTANFGTPFVTYISEMKQFLCISNSHTLEDAYQWGYDDIYTLKPDTLTNDATMQNYYEPLPDTLNKYYWVIITKDGCHQKLYYKTPPRTTGFATTTPINQGTILVYPNPSNGEFIIQFPGFANERIVSIYDMEGREIVRQSINTTTNKLTIATKLKTGNYILKVTEGNQVYHQLIMIKD